MLRDPTHRHPRDDELADFAEHSNNHVGSDSSAVENPFLGFRIPLPAFCFENEIIRVAERGTDGDFIDSFGNRELCLHNACVRFGLVLVRFGFWLVGAASGLMNTSSRSQGEWSRRVCRVGLFCGGPERWPRHGRNSGPSAALPG